MIMSLCMTVNENVRRFFIFTQRQTRTSTREGCYRMFTELREFFQIKFQLEHMAYVAYTL